MVIKQFRFLFLFLCGISCYDASAQSSQIIDSLLNSLKNSKEDTVKIDLYRELYFEYLYQDHVQSFDYIKKASVLSKEINDGKRQALANLNLCNYYWRRGKYNDARQALDIVERHLPNLANDRIETTFYLELGLVNFYEGSYNEAVKSFFNAISGYENLGDSLGLARCFGNIGNTYWEMENLDSALEYHLKSLEILKKKKDEIGVGQTLGNIGLIYRGNGDYYKALEYYGKSLAINRKNRRLRDVAIDLQNIGVAYKELGRFEKALVNFKEAYEIAKDIDDAEGTVYHSQSVATILMEQKNFQEAQIMLEEALMLARKLKMAEKEKDIYQSFSSLFEKTGQFKKALDYRILFEQEKDSLMSKSHLDKIAELETRYETAEKEKEIALLTKEKEIQEKEASRKATMTNAIIGGLAATLLLAILLFYLFRQRVRNQKLISKKNAEITEVNFRQQLSELEMKALRAQMNPHFVFNCLNSINRMILGGDIKDASSYLTKFSRLIRKVLENSEKNMVTVADELTMLKAYIQLESLRFKGKISYKTEIDQHLNLDATFIPSMVLQPLVENAIWHGLMHKEKGGTIKLSIEKDDAILKCSIEDDGVGREKNKTLENGSFMKEKSMGLQLTAERLKIMGKIGLKRFIEIIDLKDENNEAIGTRVDLLIPIE